jgi:NAD(P)-dependent dehydrogenase (short-subunit alcohol dehydrogenase family)
VLDVADAEAWEHLLADVTREYGGIDYAHLNAGIVTTPHPYEIVDVSYAQYRRVMGVNLDGVVWPSIALARVMEPRGGGSIVATASLAGLGPYYDDPFYAATKHAIVGFVRSMAPRLEPVRLNAVCPGIADTPMIDHQRAELSAAGFPLVQPEDVAEAMWRAVSGGGTGECWFVQPGREPAPFSFPSLPGPRVDGERVGRPPI